MQLDQIWRIYSMVWLTRMNAICEFMKQCDITTTRYRKWEITLDYISQRSVSLQRESTRSRIQE